VPLAGRAAAVGEEACVVWGKAVQDPVSHSTTTLAGV
jgi:hypothetical protein